MFTALSSTTNYIKLVPLMQSKDRFIEQIAKNLKKARERQGMSQEELARKADVYRTLYWAFRKWPLPSQHLYLV